MNPSYFGAPRKTESTGIRRDERVRQEARTWRPSHSATTCAHTSFRCCTGQAIRKRARERHGQGKKCRDAACKLPRIGATQDAGRETLASEQLTFTKSSRCTPPASPGMLASAPAPRPPCTETRQEQARRVRSSLVAASTSVRAQAWAAAPIHSLTLLVLGVADVAAQVVVAIVEVPQTFRERRLCRPPVSHVLAWARGARRLRTAEALTLTCPGDAGPRCRCPPGRRSTAALWAPLVCTRPAGGHRRARKPRHTLPTPHFTLRQVDC